MVFFLKVDLFLRINVDLIWVIGDVINCINLIFVVFMEGMVMVKIVFGNELIKFDYRYCFIFVFVLICE